MARDKRARLTGRRGTPDPGHERFAKLPEQVCESEAYAWNTDWSRCVLIALLVGATESNNGLLSLTASEARTRGVKDQWKLYAGLRILCITGLIACTRHGRLERGGKLCSLYGVTWRAILPNEKFDTDFDGCGAVPSNAYLKWRPPSRKEWRSIVQRIANTSRGRKKSSTNHDGAHHTNRGGADESNLTPTVVVRKGKKVAPTVVVTSEILGVGPVTRRLAQAVADVSASGPFASDVPRKVAKLRALSSLSDFDIARMLHCSVDEIRGVKH